MKVKSFKEAKESLQTMLDNNRLFGFTESEWNKLAENAIIQKDVNGFWLIDFTTGKKYYRRYMVPTEVISKENK